MGIRTHLFIAVQAPVALLCVPWIRAAAHQLAHQAPVVEHGRTPLLDQLLCTPLAEDVGARVAQNVLLAHVATPAARGQGW